MPETNAVKPIRGRPRTTPPCRNCGARAAKWPAGPSRQFCAMKCAADYAFSPLTGFCFTHEEWAPEGDGEECDQCRLDQHAAYRACHGYPAQQAEDHTSEDETTDTAPARQWIDL